MAATQTTQIKVFAGSVQEQRQSLAGMNKVNPDGLELQGLKVYHGLLAIF